MHKIITFLSLILFINTQAQIITTFAGGSIQGYSGDGGQATAAELFYPRAIAVDAAGNVYFVDGGNNAARKINTAGIISTIAGRDSSGMGVEGYSGDGGPATAARLWGPEGIAVDAFGNIYIADKQNQVIRKVNTAGIISTYAGNGTPAYSGDGGPATAGELSGPTGVAVDATGNLYIADADNQVIRKVNTAGIISTCAGNGMSGYTGDGGPAVAAELNFPLGVAIDAAGNLYIVDDFNHNVRKVNTGGIISTFAGRDSSGVGISGYSGDGGAATAAELSYLQGGIAIDANGNVYIADNNNNRVRMVNTAGIITTIAGNGYGTPNSGGYSGDGGPATSAELYSPYGVATDATGNVYIGDVNNNRIRKVYNCSNSINYPAVSYTLTANSIPHTWNAYPTYSSNVNTARWYWGDGTDTLALYPSHTYTAAGSYNICVTAYSFPCGDSAQSCQNDNIYRTTTGQMVHVNVMAGSPTTGISQFSNQNPAFSIYPNPANSIINVQVAGGNNQLADILVTDILGNNLISTKERNIDVSILPEGVYFIKVGGETKKFIKQ